MHVTRFYTFELTDTGENENYTYEEENNLCDDEETGLESMYAVFLPVLYSFLFLLGMAGNSLTVTVLLRRRRLLRITEIYLLHLALADLMLLCTFPFIVVELSAGWVFGTILCKLVGLTKNIYVLCGSFLLACIGFDRYLAIVHAIPSMQTRRPRTVHITCITLWLVSLALSIPNVVFLTVKEDHTNPSWVSCFYYQYDIHANNLVLINRALSHVCFFLPLAVMSYCYTTVAVTLCSSQKSKAKQGAIRVALLVTLIFFFCWLPFNITLLITTLVDLKIVSNENCASVVLSQVHDMTQSLGFSHCCLNPFLYAFVGVRFRSEIIKLLCQLGCHRCLPFIRAHGHSWSSVSNGATTPSSTIFI